MSASRPAPPLACERAYFDGFLARWLGQPLIPGLQSITTRIGIRVEGSPGPGWTLAVDAGRLAAIERTVEDAAVIYRVDEGTFRAIVAADLGPRLAFLAGRVRIDGDLLLGLRLSTIMEGFFRDHAWCEIPASLPGGGSS